MSRASRSWYGRRVNIGQADSRRAGARTMQTRMEGPRSKNIVPDEKIESFVLDYDGKGGDRWNEYITALFVQEMERYKARRKAILDEVRKMYLKEQQLKKLEQKNNSGSDDADNDDGCSKEGLASVETTLPKRKYEEDVYINNHTAVWGSWHKDHQWGYKCCKQFVRNSYCTSAAGIEASGATADLDIARREASEDEEKQLATWEQKHPTT